ncbi:hypothetical protein [Pedobacter sp. N23S346]|uniref:hypothetical protein n=1 Tax=Pedobacter sp. N23S346 TaxID=3402750 RepID=UPI003ABF8548
MKKPIKTKVLTLEELAKVSITKKTFQFGRSDFNYDYKKLVKLGNLDEQPDLVLIIPTEEFISVFFKAISSQLNFKLNKDFAASLEFIQQVEKYYRENNRVVIGITEQINSLLKYLLVKSALEHASNFEDVIPMFESQDKVFLLHQFNQVLFENLPVLDLPVKHVIKLSTFLIPKMESNVYYNASISQIGIGITQHSGLQETIADEYLNYCLSEPGIPTLIFAAVIAGKYHVTGNNPQFLQVILKDEKTHLSIVTAVSAFKIRDEKQALEIIDLIELINPQTDELLMGMPLFYVRLIGNSNLSGTTVINKSFSALQDLILQPNIALKQLLLHNLRMIDSHDVEISQLILSIGTEVTNKVLHDGISNALAGRNKPKCFFDFVKAHASYGAKFPVSAFDYPIHQFLDETPEEFSMELIALLIHDDGPIRLTAGQILKSVNHSRLQFNFAIDLLTLPPMYQYKLWVSVLHMDLDIERALPIVLPIRKSSSKFVADVFKLKLEYEIENYGIPIIDILEKYADHSDPDDQALIVRLKEKNEQITEMMRQKSAIKELNPYYTQSKLMKEFDEIWRAKFNSSIQKSVDKGSIISQLATTVILAKGGGWKQEDKVNSQIGQLSKIGASMVFPRQHSISPNKYDYEMRTWYIEDWTKDFKRWEATILL